MTGRTLEYEVLFSRNYAERVDWLVRLYQEFYTHFSACNAYKATDNPALRNAYAETVASFREYEIGFNMKMVALRNDPKHGKPTMVWDFVSMKQMIETAYAVLVSQPDTALRMCRHCGKTFIVMHGRSEFCDGRCRNQFNVYKWREKERAAREAGNDMELKKT